MRRESEESRVTVDGGKDHIDIQVNLILMPSLRSIIQTLLQVIPCYNKVTYN